MSTRPSVVLALPFPPSKLIWTVPVSALALGAHPGPFDLRQGPIDPLVPASTPVGGYMEGSGFRIIRAQRHCLQSV